jgi:hypothetical protein
VAANLSGASVCIATINEALMAVFDWKNRGPTLPGLLMVATYTFLGSTLTCSATKSRTPCQLVVLVLPESTRAAFAANCSGNFELLIVSLLHS